VPTVALVGYTNAGKTTLFNLLTRESAHTSDALFVTLDPLVRRVRVADRFEFLLSDTVGFIDRLPHTLVAAFRATLEEVVGADLLLHVIDVAGPGRERREAAVRSVLEEIGANDVPVLPVFNKCDLLAEAERGRLQQGEPGALLVSARAGEGRQELVDAVAARLALDTLRVTLRFDPRNLADRQRIARLYRHGRVLVHLTRDDEVSIQADVPRRWLGRFVNERNGAGARKLVS
jgi:GTP-binding protein HflX